VSPAPTGPLLVIGATDFELAPLRARLRDARAVDGGWSPAHRGRLEGLEVVVQPLGVGKVRTAAGLTQALAAHRPAAVLQVGVGGAYLGSFLSVGLAMLAEVELELDLGVATGAGWADLASLGVPLLPSAGRETAAGGFETATHAGLTGALARLTGLPRGRFATLDAITADVETGAALQRHFDVAIESMEGAAAAVVTARLEVPFAELRAVSNLVGERDRGRWDLAGAARTAAELAVAGLARLAEDPVWVGITRDHAAS